MEKSLPTTQELNKKFIQTLYRVLRDPSDRTKPSKLNTGMVTRLKRAAGRPIEESLEAVSAVYYLMKLTIEAMRHEYPEIAFEEKHFPVYFFVATNFASAQKDITDKTWDFGTTCKKIREKLAIKDVGADTFDKKFMALLNQTIDYKQDGIIDYAGLFKRLTAIRSLADANGIPINWESLLEDLPKWNSINKVIQRKWSKSYFGSTKDENENEDIEQKRENNTPNPLASEESPI